MDLLKSATPARKLRKWTRGRIPEHYKRLNISDEDAVRLAKIGAVEAMSLFGTNLFFTQALILGAIKSGEYQTFVVVTPSQYGKSWLSGQIAIMLADMGREVHVAAGTEDTTNIIMKNVIDHLQTVDDSVKQKLLDYNDKVEKLQSSTSKKKLTFKGGGSIDGITLGATTDDSKKHNKAIGRGGDYIIDEAGLVPEDAYAEVGRREFSNVDGKKGLLFQISNPHAEGMFYDKLTEDNPPEGTLILWLDVRTALEEGRFKSMQQITESDFFRNRSTCQRYLLCELENYNDESMFGNVMLDDSPPDPGYTYFIGVDSAYKGVDKIPLCLSATTPEGKVRVLDIMILDKKEWVDGLTSELIVQDILNVVKRLNVKFICCDIGFGVYIVEGLAKHANEYGEFFVKGINFGAGTTKIRKEKNHFSAKYGYNMRAELHMDMQQLMDSGNLTFTSKTAKMLSKQMEAVRTQPRPNGKTAIISKDEIKARIGHSPDELDSCLLSIHALLMYNMSGGIYVYTENDE